MIDGKLIGEVATSAQLAIYRHHVRNGTVPKSIPAWAKKKMVPKVKVLPKGPVYPLWTYKRTMNHIPSKIPGWAYDGASTERYVTEFDRLNYYV